MGSVIDFTNCPQCGNEEASIDYYYKTGEEYLLCDKCGYQRKFVITNREDIGKKDEDGFETLPKFELEELKACGCYRLQMKGGVGYEIGAFTQEQSEDEFIKFIEENKENVQYAMYYTFKDGVLSNEIILINNDLENKE